MLFVLARSAAFCTLLSHGSRPLRRLGLLLPGGERHPSLPSLWSSSGSVRDPAEAPLPAGIKELRLNEGPVSTRFRLVKAYDMIFLSAEIEFGLKRGRSVLSTASRAVYAVKSMQGSRSPGAPGMVMIVCCIDHR